MLALERKIWKGRGRRGRERTHICHNESVEDFLAYTLWALGIKLGSPGVLDGFVCSLNTS